MSRAMGGQLGQDANEITEQSPNAAALDANPQENSISARVNLNLDRFAPPPLPSDVATYPYMQLNMHSPNPQDQLNNLSTTHINYGPGRMHSGIPVENIHQEENPYNQDHVNLQRNSLYGAAGLQRNNIVASRVPPYNLHQAIQEHLQNFQQEQQQLQQPSFGLQGFQPGDHMMQFDQQFVQGGGEGNRGPPGMENPPFPGRRMPHVRQQRVRRRSRANRAHVMHVNSAAAEMALGHGDAPTILPGTLTANLGETIAEIEQSHIQIGLRQERLQGLSAAVVEDASAPVGENFECNICFQKANEAVVTCCGHLFCWPCLYRWLHVHSSHKECPVCKGAIDECSMTPIYGRENALATARKHGALGAERIPPRPQARRVESERQLREREERERERDMRDRENERNLTSNVVRDRPHREESPVETQEFLGDGAAPTSGGEGNIHIHLDQRELDGTSSDLRELSNTLNFTLDSGELRDVDQQRQESHANTSNTPREDSYATMYIGGREGGTMDATYNHREETTANVTTDQREVRTSNIFRDLPTVEDAQPNVLRGGAARSLTEGFGNPVFGNPRAELLHQRMGQRREQLRAALSGSRGNLPNSMNRAEDRQDVMQAAALLSQEWDDLVNISRVAANPVQAAAWLAVMHARLANMETNPMPQQLHHALPQNIQSLSPPPLESEGQTNDTTRPLVASQSGELLAAMRTRFNNIQRIQETLQRPSFTAAAALPSLEALSSEQSASGWTELHLGGAHSHHPPSEPSAPNEEAQSYAYGCPDARELLQRGANSSQRSMHSNEEFNFHEHSDEALEDLDTLTTLPLSSLIDQRRGSRIDRDERSARPEAQIDTRERSSSGDVLMEMTPRIEGHVTLESEQILRTRMTDDEDGDVEDRSRDELEDDASIGGDAPATTHERKRRRTTDIV